MFVIALRTWTTTESRGKITIVGDASGVISDMVAMRARAPSINNLIKETALHLAPFGLDLQGLHVWAELNKQADELSRMKDGDAAPTWLDPTTKKTIPISVAPQMWRHCVPVQAKGP